MDQVKAFLSVVWAQRFWVLSVVGTIIAVLCWNMAASDLSADFSKRQGEINKAHSDVKSINGEQFHPNDDVIAGDTKQAQVQRDMVREVWQELYDAQRADVLKWPETIGKEFVDYMESRKFGDDISEEMRGFYHNYIETRFDSLLEVVKARKMVNKQAGSRAGGYGGQAGPSVTAASTDEDEDYLVEWVDQGELQRKLSFREKPKTIQVWVTQEDLWVYETLLKVISETNVAKGAQRPDNTAVRAIVQLQVGAMAANPSTGQVIIPQPSEDEGGGGEFGEFGDYGGYGGYGGGEYGGDYGAGGYGGGEFGGDYGAGGYGAGGEYGAGGYGGGEFGAGGGYGMGGRGGGGGEGSLLMRRYLDAEGKPDEGGSVESVVSTEFRQLPIRMRLMMDEKFIPTLLLKCANATLPIEVKQVRINPSKSGAGFGGNRSSRSSIRGLNQMSLDDLTEVIIRGAVYIYNEPDTDRLTIPGEDLAQPGDEIAQVTSP